MLNLASVAYDAALDEHKWPHFLKTFADVVGGSSAMLRSVELHTHKAGFVASSGYDPAWKSAYCDHFVKLDYYAPYFKQMALGVAAPGEGAISRAEQRKTEFYNDYCIPQDKVHNMGALLEKEGGRTLLFAVQRGKRAGTFGEAEIRMMNRLAPHVARAVQVHRKLGSVAVQKEWALGALDQLRTGVILTDRLGAPLFVNRAAEAMLAPANGISVCHGRLVLETLSETALLHKLIAGAAQGTTGAATGGDMRIALPGRREFLHCLVTPVSPELSARCDIFVAPGCAALFLSKPGSLQLPPKRLASLYGLSPAESRLAAKLAEFNTLEQAAYGLGISLSTARVQLSSVFTKTGAKGQAELLMLLATGMLAHCRDA
jgi:DNA-binding CsgD family transcriptional regulator/GAF domain-containing protein